MTDTVVTPALVAALERALYSGHKSVQYGERRIEYRTLDEMRQALTEARQELAGKRRIRRATPNYDSGL